MKKEKGTEKIRQEPPVVGFGGEVRFSQNPPLSRVILRIVDTSYGKTTPIRPKAV